MQRRRNIDANRARQEREQQRLQEQAMKTQYHYAMKQEQQTSIMKNRHSASQRTKQEALETKLDKQANRHKLEQNRRMEEQKAQNLKLMIRHQQ